MKLLLGALVLTLATVVPAEALVSVSSPDDICAATDDPCVVAEPMLVATLSTFDFGTRTLWITGAGRLEGESIAVRCGSFVVDVGAGKVAIDTSNSFDGGSLEIFTRHGCSGDPAVPCSRDADCASQALGECSAGDASIIVDGIIKGRGPTGGFITLDAEGEISLAGVVDVSATRAGDREGGFIEITAGGALVSDALLKAKAGKGSSYDYGSGDGGGIDLYSFEGDIVISGKIDTSGGSFGGYLLVSNDDDIVISSDINCNSGDFYGGDIAILAGANAIVTGPTGPGQTRISNNGAGRFYAYDNEWYSGSGGYTWFEAHNIIVQENTRVEGLGGPFSHDGGKVYMTAYGGTIDLAGEIMVDGNRKARGGDAGFMSIRAAYGSSLSIHDTAVLSASSSDFAGSVRLRATGPVRMDGRVVARSTGKDIYYGGSVWIYGDDDVSIGGVIKDGSASGYGGSTLVEACRLTVKPTAVIENLGGDNRFNVSEGMSAEDGSIIRTTGPVGENLIYGYNSFKPPLLLGEIEPPPTVSVGGDGDPGCAVCGNSEIDFAESCDDGNALSGDGCSDTCQDEACVAATPGFPGTDLCDDADACTIDSCVAGGMGCQHIASCEEGVACTIDSCDADVCTHTPSDSACDDDNECTDDLCNAVTGCVHANLTGNGCEDDDLCTVTGACVAGRCEAVDVSLAEDGKIFTKFNAGVSTDKATIKGDMPLAEYLTAPTDTGLDLRLFDQDEQTVFTARIPASFFVDVRGDGTKFRYRRSASSMPGTEGVHSVWIRPRPSKGVAKVKIALKDSELSGALDQSFMSLSLLFGTDPAVDECLSMRSLPCTNSSKRTRCKT